MTKVILLGPLVHVYGFREKEFSGEDLFEILSKFDTNHVIINNNTQVKPGFLVLIDGVDWRIRGTKVNENNVITIIPINHGG